MPTVVSAFTIREEALHESMDDSPRLHIIISANSFRLARLSLEQTAVSENH